MRISTDRAAARHPEDDASHFVQFYESDVELIEDVGTFLQRALDAGGSAIAIATADHVTAMTSWLDSADTATRRARDAIFVDAHAALDGFMVDGWPDEARFMSTVGALVARTVRRGQPVHAFGEMVAILYAQGLGEAALHLEHLWNGLAREHRFSLFCAYPDREFIGAEHTPPFRHICDAHHHVFLTRTLRNAGSHDLHLRLALAQQRATSLEDEMRRRQSAELQRDAMLMNSPIASALLLGNRHTFQLTNPRYLAMVGRANLIGLPYLDAFPEEAGGATVAALRRVFADGVPIVHEEYRANRPGDAEERVYTLHFDPLRASSGNVDGVILSAVEVTGYVRAREAVEKSRTEREALLADLRNANGAKDRFLAMLGHELRNPLAPISTALALVRKQNGGKADRQHEIIERQVAHLSRLVEDLLDVSRITRGPIELAREPVPIATLLARAVEAANPVLEQRSQTLSLDLTDDGGIVCGDAFRLTQVFGNLLNNAAKFTQTGGRIHVKAVTSATEIVVSVADNGVGISADLMPRMFSFFEQGETTIDRANGGLGVGLALVKNFVQLHGGTVVASSDGPGRGATFTVTLPLAPAPTTDCVEQPAMPHPVGNGARVLLVDDNKDGLMAMEAYLVELGFHVATATDPATALEVAAAFSPAFAVLDIGLPGMDGYQLARALRAQPTVAPVRMFALTGYGLTEDRRRSNEAGFERHFVKPVALAELVEALTGPSGGERCSV
ncbi:ATP-binding protein [Paraburkholderia sp. BR13439]|uniref:ATP-binding protein n=1 Tax=Paraburkholderia sp. BR13439 TaxID=3236996 RepID=UPI0034CD590E